MIDINKTTLNSSRLAGSREGSGDRGMRGTFAFGSSTPRILSHLSSTTIEYYNERINPQVGRRSYTTPTFPTPRSKTVGASMNVQMKRTDGITQKTSETVTRKGTCGVLSTSYELKDGSEKFMDSVKKKLEAQNDKAKSAKKIVDKEKQLKSKKAEGKKTEVEKQFAKTGFSEVTEKLSPASARFGNENEKALLVKKSKPEATLGEIRQFLTVSTVEDEIRLLPARSIPAEKIVLEEAAENVNKTKMSGVDNQRERGTTQILHEGSERREIDVSIQPKLTGQDHLTDTFSIISKKNHVEAYVKSNSEHKDVRGLELSINSESEKREPSPSIGLYIASPISMTIDPGTSPTKLSSSLARECKLKDEYYLKSSEDKVIGGETIPETSVDSRSEQDRLPKITESIPGSTYQLQGNGRIAFDTQPQGSKADHKIIL
ncbi:hypothetical protein LOAG_01761 [Loa loa]|uniref:Uncharacterized protein n=2 Tax=Loa loa TaxID=7209 RepID=A0A1S0U890_LOALO|nr:hypothetical protein LOAG_01761 [Loa loa]EFO26729.1 hypothetical protein LOAG_01761 [Loa loa]